MHEKGSFSIITLYFESILQELAWQTLSKKVKRPRLIVHMDSIKMHCNFFESRINIFKCLADFVKLWNKAIFFNKQGKHFFDEHKIIHETRMQRSWMVMIRAQDLVCKILNFLLMWAKMKQCLHSFHKANTEWAVLLNSANNFLFFTWFMSPVSPVFHTIVTVSIGP